MRKKVNDNKDIQIYGSDAGSSSVTIGEWKSERTAIESAITSGKRLCTYADLVADYIKMAPDVLNTMGIEELPNHATTAIDSIVVVRGRECVPYAVASKPESLYVRLKKSSASEGLYNFNFSGESGNFPKITCEEEYNDVKSSTGKSAYKFNTVIEYVSTDFDIASGNIVKRLWITLNNFDLVPYVYTDTEVNYKNSTSAAEALNMGILTFDESSSSQVSNPRKLSFKITSIQSRLSPNPKGDLKYLYNYYPILKFGGFTKKETMPTIPGTGTVIYGPNQKDFYSSTLEMYKKIYPEKPDYDYGGRIKLSYKPYEGLPVEDYDLLEYFDDDDPGKTMRPHADGPDANYHGFFTPGTFNGVANIVVDAHKNNPIQVIIRTNGKVIVRNLSESRSEIQPGDETNYEKIKKMGQMLIMMSDSYANAYTPVDDPGRLLLGILPNKENDPDYDKYKAFFTVTEPGERPYVKELTIVFEKDGYILDVNELMNNGEPFDPGDPDDPGNRKQYEIRFQAIHKYIPKTITLKEYKLTEDSVEKRRLDYVLLAFSKDKYAPTDPDSYKETTLAEASMYYNHWYKTEEGDFSDENQSTFWTELQLYKPDSQYMPYWNKFFEIDGLEREITHFRISMSNGRYNTTGQVMYWTGSQQLWYQYTTDDGTVVPASNPKPSPENISLIYTYIKYIHGTEETPLTIPKTLDLYIRTLGRISVHFMLCPGYALNGQENRGTEPIQIDIFINFEDIQRNRGSFTLKRIGITGNNTITSVENFTSFDDKDSDKIALTCASGFRFTENEEKTVYITVSDVLQNNIYIVLTSIQAAHMIVEIQTSNLSYVGNDYLFVNGITQVGQGLYLGLWKATSQSSNEGPAKVQNAEKTTSPYISNPAERKLIIDETNPLNNYFKYEFDIECTKWYLTLEYVATTAIGTTTYLPTVPIKEVSVQPDGSTVTVITISDQYFKLASDISSHKQKLITNPTGVDDVTVTIRPERWAILKVNLKIAKKTLTYNPTYKVWLKPTLVDGSGTKHENLYDWNYSNSEYCTGYFYVPDFYSVSIPRMFKLSFTPYYLNNGAETKLEDGETETTLSGFDQFTFSMEGSSSQYTFNNTGLIIDTTKEQFKQINDVLCVQHNKGDGLFRETTVNMTPKEGPPHMVLRGVRIDEINYKASTFDTNPPMLRPVKGMIIYVYLYCPSLEEGLETGEFDGNVPYNNSFTVPVGATQESGTFMGDQYTHVFTFKNNENSDFFELNEQYPTNGVASVVNDSQQTPKEYLFTVTLNASSGIYDKEISIRVTDVAKNYLESSVVSIIPDPGAEFWIDACAYVWRCTAGSNAVEKIEIDESTVGKPAYSFSFSDAPESVDTYFNVSRVGKRSTFTARGDVTFPDYLTLRADITYDAPYVEGIIKEIPMNRKMLLIKQLAYNGSEYSETYEYIYPLPYSQTIQLHLLCPSIEQDQAYLYPTGGGPYVDYGLLNSSDVPGANVTAYFSTHDILEFDDANPQLAVYENQQIDFSLEYRPNDPSEPRPTIEFSYKIGAMGEFYIAKSEGDITDTPGNTFTVTIYRETFVEEGKKKLIATDACDFPFDVTFEILEGGMEFSDYFDIYSGPQETGADRGMYVIKRNNTALTKSITVVAKAKMTVNLFPWILAKQIRQKVNCVRYINFFTSDTSVSTSDRFFLSPCSLSSQSLWSLTETQSIVSGFELRSKDVRRPDGQNQRFWYVTFIIKKISDNNYRLLRCYVSEESAVDECMYVGSGSYSHSTLPNFNVINTGADYSGYPLEPFNFSEDSIMLFKNESHIISEFNQYVFGSHLSGICKYYVDGWGLTTDDFSSESFSTRPFWSYQTLEAIRDYEHVQID